MAVSSKNAVYYGVLHMELKAAVHEAVKNLPNDWFCGFAYVNIDGTHPFAKWLKSQGDRLGFKGYPKGYDISMYPLLEGTVHAGTQSMYVKEEAARAVVRVLAKHGIVGRAHSRPD